MTRFCDSTVKTRFGQSVTVNKPVPKNRDENLPKRFGAGPARVAFEQEPITVTDYNYTDTLGPITINSKPP